MPSSLFHNPAKTSMHDIKMKAIYEAQHQGSFGIYGKNFNGIAI